MSREGEDKIKAAEPAFAIYRPFRYIHNAFGRRAD
jgi:hypothetical protein